MFSLKPYLTSYSLKNIRLLSLRCASTWFVEHLNKRTILKLSGPDTNTYMQSMMTNDIKQIEKLPAIYSLLLNPRGFVLYDILLYKISDNDYLIEYDKSALEYLQLHLLMYRLRKNIKIQPVELFSVWSIYPECEENDSSYLKNLQLLSESFIKQEGVTVSVIDPRTALLGVRVVTLKDANLFSKIPQGTFKFLEGNSYRAYRYKLGIGEGVFDHPPGRPFPFDTNFDFLNGVSFSKGCYIGQELTARLQFTTSVVKRLMPVVLEPKDSYPEFSPDCKIVNEKGEKMGKLRGNVGQYGLAMLKFEESLKAKYLVIKDFDVKLKVTKPSWWPDNMKNTN